MSGRNVFRDMRSLKRQYVNEIAESLTDKDIFESPETQSYANALAKSMIGSDTALDVKMCFDPRPEAHIGYTTKNFIYVNGGHPFISSYTSLTDRIMTATGILFHEIAHCIFMDFNALVEAIETIEKGSFYGRLPIPQNKNEELYLKEMEIAIKDKRFQHVFINAFKQFHNCVADEHDERALIARYGNYEAACIHRAKDMLRYEHTPLERRLEDVANKKRSQFSLAVNVALELARFGEIYIIDPETTKNSDLYKSLMTLRPAFARAVESEDNDDLVFSVNQTMLVLWPFIRAELLNNSGAAGSSGGSNQQGSGGQGQSGCSSGSSSGSSGGSQGSSSGSASQGGSSAGGQNPPQNGPQSGHNGSNHGQASGGGEEDKTANSGGSGANGDDSVENAAKEFEKALSQMSDEDIESLAKQIADEAKQFSTEAPEQPNGMSAKKPKSQSGNSGNEAGAQNSTAGDEQASGNDSSDGADSDEVRRKAEEVANKLLRKIAEHMADSMVENDLNQELMVLARGTGFNSTHKGYPMRVTRCTGEDPAAYQKIARQQKSLLNSMVRQMKMVFKDMANNNVKPHQVTGNRFKASDAHRLDGLCFTSKKAVSNEPDIAVTVLVDKSGSMDGRRIAAARESALLVYDFCTELKIPCMVCGHCIPGGMDFEIFSDFRHQEKDKYRIAAGLARAKNACNRDGMALQIAAGLLEKRPEPVKLLMIISDGQPADHCYSGHAAEADIQEIVRKNARKGVKTIALAIGDDKKRISEIYGERYIDISDLAAMPKKLARIVRRYILESIG